jgi:AbrB family looped-hinge helix DNA binding protein
MITATLTSKGQLTIPKAVRESLHLHTGDRVEFIVRTDGEAVMKPVTKSVDDVFGRLHRPGQPSKNIEEMKMAVAERMRTRKQ